MINVESVVQKQLDAYNAHDAIRFSDCFSDHVQVFRHPDQTPLFTNKIDMLTFYKTHRFNQPALHAKLVNRIVIGNKVFDHEFITGLDDVDKEVVAIYQIENQLINQVWFVDP